MEIMTVKTPEKPLVYMPSLQCGKYSQQNESPLLRGRGTNLAPNRLQTVQANAEF